LSGIVLDASVALSWCFRDELTPNSIEVQRRIKAGETARVPTFWAAEVLNTVLVGERRGRITAEEGRLFLDDLRTLDLEVDAISVDRLFEVVQAISRKYGITPYDALYIELALREKCPLATLDLRQRVAAVDLGVQCL
jgi:predicted nucleic acid-binding protein